jgi:phytoene dehydrogenase-like protein
MDEFDVVVVGAGMGGAVCAALLAQRGTRVALIDKNAVPGGKAMTVGHGDFRYELWPVVSGPSLGSRFAEVLDELGMSDEVELLTPDNVLALMYRADGGYRTMVGSATPNAAGGVGMIDLLGLVDTDLPELIRLQLAITETSGDELDALDEVTFADWLGGFDVPTSVHTYFAMQANLLFVVPIDRLAASEAIRTIADFVRGGAGRYHAGGYGRVAEACCEAVERAGGRVVLGSRVERILVEGGRACGVETEHETIRARAVVSNAGIQPTVLRLVGDEHFDDGYVENVRALTPSWAIAGIRYELDTPFFEHGMYVTFGDDNVMTADRFAALRTGWLPDELSVFNVVPAVYDPSLAPAGRQIALVGTFCDPDPDLPEFDAILRRLDETVAAVWPGMHDHVVASHPYGTSQVSKLTRDAVVPGQGGECIGLAQIVGQCGRHKPDARSPLAGLYFVGCDAGGYGCGTHQAADSGMNVAAIVRDDLAGR